MWRYDPKGDFSVKSAYKVAFALRVHPTSSVHSSLINLCGTIYMEGRSSWKSEIVCMENWKACRNILPTVPPIQIWRKKKVWHWTILVSFVVPLRSWGATCSYCLSFCSAVFLSSKLPLGPRMAGSHLFSDRFSHCAESLPSGVRLIFF